MHKAHSLYTTITRGVNEASDEQRAQRARTTMRRFE